MPWPIFQDDQQLLAKAAAYLDRQDHHREEIELIRRRALSLRAG